MRCTDFCGCSLISTQHQQGDEVRLGFPTTTRTFGPLLVPPSLCPADELLHLYKHRQRICNEYLVNRCIVEITHSTAGIFMRYTNLVWLFLEELYLPLGSTHCEAAIDSKTVNVTHIQIVFCTSVWLTWSVQLVGLAQGIYKADVDLTSRDSEVGQHQSSHHTQTVQHVVSPQSSLQNSFEGNSSLFPATAESHFFSLCVGWYLHTHKEIK